MWYYKVHKFKINNSCKLSCIIDAMTFFELRNDLNNYFSQIEQSQIILCQVMLTTMSTKYWRFTGNSLFCNNYIFWKVIISKIVIQIR